MSSSKLLSSLCYESSLYAINWKSLASFTDAVKEAHTKQLMRWLPKIRECKYSYDHFIANNHEECLRIIKAELATREHIPNKIEAKELRRLKAQGKF